MDTSIATPEPSEGLADRYPDPFLTILVTLRRKRSVPADLFYPYWRDAHCQISAKLPGQYHLWTHWLDYESGQCWPRTAGIDNFLAEEDRFDGIPELVIRAEEDLQELMPKIAPLSGDDGNIFEETIGYRALGGNSRTFVDRFTDPAPVFDEGALRLLVFTQKSDEVSVDGFRAFMFNELAPAWSSSEDVLKLRMHLFEAHDNEHAVTGADGVSYYKAPEKQYQAAFEICFADTMAMKRFAASENWLAERQSEHIRAHHSFRVSRRYTMRYKGKLTLGGLRTHPVAEQIHRMGALNQVAPNVIELLGGY